MNSGLDRIDLNGIAGSIGGWPGKAHIGYFKFGLVWLPAGLIAAMGAWMLLSGYASKPAEGEPVVLAMAVAANPFGYPQSAHGDPRRAPDGVAYASHEHRGT